MSAERNFAARDPNTCLLKLRQFGEALAQHVAAVFAIDVPAEGKQVDLLVLLQRKGHLDRSVADMLHLLTTQDPGQLSAHLKILSDQKLADYLKQHAPLLDALKQLQLGRISTEQIISDHHDELVALETGYGAYSRPEDYLDAFRQFITDNRNKIAALDIVMTRPREPMPRT